MVVFLVLGKEEEEEVEDAQVSQPSQTVRGKIPYTCVQVHRMHPLDLVFCQSLRMESMHLERRSTFLLNGGCFGLVVSIPGGMRGKAVLERYSAPLHEIVK